jgi:hypothetical protein
MIKSDVLKSENANAIIEAKYFKTNFGFADSPKAYKAKQVLNIDITSAYATCLVQNGLISVNENFKLVTMINKIEKLYEA